MERLVSEDQSRAEQIASQRKVIVKVGEDMAMRCDILAESIQKTMSYVA